MRRMRRCDGSERCPVRLERSAAGFWIAALGFAVVVSGLGEGCQRREIVAKVGKHVVTREEFERQFSRQPLPEGANSDSLRARFLESMIQKELLVLEADERGLFRPDSTIDSQVKEFAETFLRKRVRDDEAKVDTTVADAEIQKAFELSRQEVRLRHIQHWSEATIDSARRRIQGGEPFADVARQVSEDRGTAAQGGLVHWLNKLQLPSEFRSAIDTARVGQMVGPVKSSFGWHVIRVDSARQREGADLKADRDPVRAEILNERSRLRLSAFQAEYRKRYHYEIDEPAIAAAVNDGFKQMAAMASDTTRRNVPLVERWMPADSSRVVSRYDGKTFTVGDYRRFLLKAGPLNLRQRMTPPGAVAIINELFYDDARLREAKRLKYDRDRLYQDQIKLKREELVVQRLYENQVVSEVKVSEADARAYFDEHPEQFRRPERFRYAFMRVNDAAVAEALVPEIAKLKAAAFDSLAAQLQQRGHLIQAERDSGFRDADRAGAVPAAARKLKLGQVGHVVEADGSHTVFVLIQHQPEIPETYERASPMVKMTLTNRHSEERLMSLLKELERKYAVKRYPERLASSG